MSKTKGNVIDPLNVTETYGVDALRCAFAMAATQTRHVRFGIKQVEKERNFVTKLWNVARFLLLQGVTFEKKSHKASWIFSQWIVGEVVLLQEKVSQLLEEYRFHELTLALHHFTWDVFCDKFVELAKNALRQGEHLEEMSEILGWVFHRMLLLLHPIIPFVTEEIWGIFWGETGTTRTKGGYLCHAQWTLPSEVFERDAFKNISQKVHIFYNVLTAIRHLRAEFRIDQNVLFSVKIYGASFEEQEFLETEKNHLLTLAGCESLDVFVDLFDVQKQNTKGMARISVEGMMMVIPISAFVDVELERMRLQKVLEKEERVYENFMEKLQKEDFLSCAPQEVVEDIRERAEKQKVLVNQVRTALAHVS